MSTRPIISLKVQSSADLILVRQRAQAIAEFAKLDTIKQTSFATALSEIARNALQFAQSARVDFVVETQGPSHFLSAIVSDNGPGIPSIRERGGSWDRSIVFEGHGINSARRLVKLFSIDCPAVGGTIVKLGVPFPPDVSVGPEQIASWGEKLAQLKHRNLLEEIHHRNQELVNTLEELRRKEGALKTQAAEDMRLKAELAESKALLEVRVKERTESLMISNEALQAFSYTVSHDLRAPLRAINGFIHILLEDHVNGNDVVAARLIQDILGATTRMDSLVQDLVAYTQVSKINMPIIEVNSRALIDDLLKQTKPTLLTQDAKIEIVGEFPNINANPAILQSVLLNLLENAVKFRKPNQQPYICFRGETEKRMLRLIVEDNGIGIAPEHHDQIFGVFERLHGRDVPGTGIGLALVKRWVGSMQGAVGVQSDLGKGARFWIELPITPAATIR